MNIDATFWVAVAFFIFFGGLVYLKVPQKVNASLSEKINLIFFEATFLLNPEKEDLWTFYF